MPVVGAPAPTDGAFFSISIPESVTFDLENVSWQSSQATGSNANRWIAFKTNIDSTLLYSAVGAVRPTLDNVSLAFSDPKYKNLTNTTIDFQWYVSGGGSGDSDIDNILIEGTASGTPGATLTAGPTVEVSDNHSSFDLSVFPGTAGYDDGTDSGAFGDGTVLDYRFFDSPGNTFNQTGYADGGAGLVGPATATNTNGDGESWANVWTTNDPGTDPPNFPDTVNTFAHSQGVTGTVDIRGLSEGSLNFIYGSYEDPSTLILTMSGVGKPDVQVWHVEDPPNTNKGFITSFDFADAEDYHTISYSYTNADTDGSRARFMGVIVDGVASFDQAPGPIAGTDFSDTLVFNAPGGQSNLDNVGIDDLNPNDNITVTDWAFSGGGGFEGWDGSAQNGMPNSPVTKLNGDGGYAQPNVGDAPPDFNEASFSIDIPAGTILDLVSVTWDWRASTDGTNQRWLAFRTSLDDTLIFSEIGPARDAFDSAIIALDDPKYKGLSGQSVAFYWYASGQGSGDIDLDTIIVNGQLVRIPEPSTLALAALGLLGLGWCGRRRRRRTA